MREAIAAAGLCTAMMLGSTVASTPPAAAGPAPPTVDWAPCPAGPGVDPRQECGTVSVPMDHADPGGPRIDVAVSRIRTAEAARRRGVLLLIPGGPGGSGLNRPSGHGLRLPAPVTDRYDIVSFDPRGVGASTPVSCQLPAEDVAPTRLWPWPEPDGDITPSVERAARTARACARDGGPLLPHLSTRDEARDVDEIRRALGEPRLSLWGVSYGSYVGAVYATLYPHRTDRVLLDSVGDPDPRRVARGWAANLAVGIEDRFPDFAAWAANRHDTYRLGAQASAVRETFLRLAETLDTGPLDWPGAVPPVLDGNALRATMANALYADARFPQLAELMSAASAGGPLPPTSAPPEAVLQNTTAVAAATVCNDVAWPRSIDGYARDVAANRLAYPLTAGMPVNIFPCAFWAEPAEPAVRVGPRGPSNVLLIQNLRDPSTPHSGALRMRAAFGDRARMVSVDSGGHGAYLAEGNACGDRTATDFLVSGRRPAHDVTCEAVGGGR